jgi:hypothetical protein
MSVTLDCTSIRLYDCSCDAEKIEIKYELATLVVRNANKAVAGLVKSAFIPVNFDGSYYASIQIFV